MGERYLVLPLASAYGTHFDDFDSAQAAAGTKVETDGAPHVIVRVVGEVRRRTAPNVDVVRFDAEAANG